MTTLFYFGWVRERIGRGEERVQLAADLGSVGDLVQWLVDRGEPYASTMADRDRLRAAVDGTFAAMEAPVAGAREIALFPPVTGG